MLPTSRYGGSRSPSRQTSTPLIPHGWWAPKMALSSSWQPLRLNGSFSMLTNLVSDYKHISMNRTINSVFIGYYRVNYDDENWQLISNQLRDNHHFIPVLNRAQLLDDSLTVARTGELSYSVVMELMRYLRSERDYVPWKAALSGLDYLDRMLYHTPGKDKFRVKPLTLTIRVLWLILLW